jgi:hypothetical protein
MKSKEEVRKKIESILNRYYKETGKEIVNPIEVFKELNNKFNFKMKIKFKEQVAPEKENYLSR